MADPCLSPTARVSLTLVGPTRALSADIVPSAALDSGIQLDSTGLYAPRVALLAGGAGASFPTGSDLRDGMTVAVQIQSGRRWTFQYSAGSTNSSKWEFIGGAAVYSNTPTQGSIQPSGGNNWLDLSGSDVAGPDYVPPFPGLYQVQFGARIYAFADNNQAQVGLSVGGADPSANNIAGNGNQYGVSVTYTCEVTVGANQRLRLLYRSAGTSSANALFDERWMRVLPVRVG